MSEGVEDKEEGRRTESYQADNGSDDEEINYTVFDNLQAIVSSQELAMHYGKLTIQRRCLRCLIEYRGARICFEGRNQTAVNVSKQFGLGTKRKRTEDRGVESVKVGNQHGRGQHE